MTSPTGGSEHISRYRALGEFDNLIREAERARRAIRELREEEAKLNAQSLADDKKVAASKADRAKSEKEASESTKRSVGELTKAKEAAGKSGEDAATAFNKRFGSKLEQDSRSGANNQFLQAATKALGQAFANAGDESGKTFTRGFGKRVETDTIPLTRTSLDKASKSISERMGKAGSDSGFSFVSGMNDKLRSLNSILSTLKIDKLDLDVDIDDAQQSIKAIEFELERLGHETVEPQVRIDSNRALTQLRLISKGFKDELGEKAAKESARVRAELEKVDALPSGKSFKFWALTALSDMSRVFEEADRGTSVFNKLRLAAAGGGGGGNFIKTFVSGFDDFSESSSNLLQKLGRVSGELYRMPGIIGILVSAIPALVSGLGAIGGGALGLSSALGSVVGFLAAGPPAIAAFSGAIGAMSIGMSGLKDVFKAATKAEAEKAEAAEKDRLGTDKALTATQKYAVMLKQLSPATRDVTQQLVGMSHSWHELQSAVGEKFFKEIADDVKDLNKLFPVAENYFGRSATALGHVADAGIKMLTSGPWKRDFGIIAKNNAVLIENMGHAGLALANVFRNVAVAAGPFTTWIAKALRDGANAFSDWSAEARSDGTIVSFLDETKESAQSLWQIMKNLGNVVNSFFQSTVDEGQSYLRTLDDITGHWADVAKAQEQANSPLREWMTNIRPVLGALGALIADLSRGIGNLASNQSNIQSMIDLLVTLRTNVLPPILEILQHLNESGIAVTVTRALGDMLDAIAKFLDSGATTALTVFVTVLANFAELLFNIASLPGVSNVLGAVASGLAALAAVSIVARFTGLFKLWDFFTWMVRNKGNLSGAFADAARGAAGLQTTGASAVPKNIPSPIAYTGVGSEVLNSQAKATEAVARASEEASGKVSVFSRTLTGVRTAGSTARSALSGLTGFLGGPWGVALIAATTVIGLVSSKLIENKQQARDTKDAFLALKGAYGDLKSGNTDAVTGLSDTNEAFKRIVDQARDYNLSLTDVSGALNNNGQSLNQFNNSINSQIDSLKAARDEQIAYAQSQGDTTGAFNDGINALQDQIDEAEKYKRSVNGVANATANQNKYLRDAAALSRTYQSRLAGMTQSQVDNANAVTETSDKIKLLSGALDTMASASSTAEQRSKALSDIINHETGSTIRANEATEAWRSRLIDLRESIQSNGRSLDSHSRAGLRNRDALEEAAKATRELFLQDIASGKPMADATKAHQARIRELIKEADKANLSKTETRKLIDAYGDVPDDVKTDIATTGYAKVYQQMMDLKALQASLQSGKSVAEAQREVEESKARGRAHGYGDGYGMKLATGGPVYGEGTRTSDSIRAWLSNGEFVQPTDAVDYYGMPVMEALRTRKLDKAVIQEALPDDSASNFASGGHAHSNNCVACASGGHKFANGGYASWPFKVDNSDALIKKSWANDLGGLGGGAGGNGWKWQAAVLHKAFPGLNIISGFRPGARTLTGNRSYHAVGRAVDLPPRRDVAQWIRANYGARTKELITPYQDLNLWNGKPHHYHGAVWNQHNFAGGNAHDHWAFKDGGLVDLMNMLNMNNLAPQQQQALPSTPRTLSPAASSVVNNSTENSRTFGDVIINNPVPERGGDSIRDAIYRTQLLL